MEAKAYYYNGKSSARQSVVLSIREGVLHAHGAQQDFSWPLDVVQVSAPLASLDRTLYLPDGGTCELPDGPLVRQLEGEGRPSQVLHRWETSLKLAFVALVLTVGVVWGFIQYGVPLMAETAAHALPPATEEVLGRESLALLDGALFIPSTLPDTRQTEIRTVFDQVCVALEEQECVLIFRSSPQMGANALALPGGLVVVTDQFVELVEDEQELAAVLAHEVGHVKGRHILRRIFQNMGSGLIVATLTGDLTSVSALAATLPAVMVVTKFSRDMEREADDVAAEYLRSQGLSTEPFVTILGKLQSSHQPQGQGGSEGGVSDYFSTHPGTQERIERMMDAAD